MSFRTIYVSLLTAALWLGCSKEKGPAPVTDRVAVATPAAEEQTQAAFEGTLPKVGRDEYVGSSHCQKCHEDQYSSWHHSFHRTMTQVVSDESVQADFNNVVLTTDTARFILRKSAGEYWVRMEPLVSPAGGSTPALDQRLSLVTGSHHMQVFWVPEGSGNLQLGFPFTWLIPEKRWVPRNSTFIRPPQMAHRSELWNVTCSRCHTTAVVPHVDFATRSAQTAVAELGISCEACHGPAARHVETQRAATGQNRSLAAGEIINPKKISAERGAEICGFCHSMKWFDKTSRWRDKGFEFRPGDKLEETTPVIRPSRIAEATPSLKESLARNPDLLDDFFWPDGMVRVSGRELNGLIESPCYKSGKFSCISCHSLHESDPNDQLAEKAKGNGACLQCHDKFREPAALAAHSHHGPLSSGSECYNCHMPHTTYGILTAIRSHQISSPRVADELKSGRPNACNLCHLDQTLAWTSGKLSEWYGHEMPILRKFDTNVPAIAQLALAGDAGQRVLAAWHLGWEQALTASKTNWIAPLLGRMLDDPYAAVRCVAERSLKNSTKMSVASYDFSFDVREREPVHAELWAKWEKSNNQATGPLLQNGRIDRELYNRIVIGRDDRPVRLRE